MAFAVKPVIHCRTVYTGRESYYCMYRQRAYAAPNTSHPSPTLNIINTVRHNPTHIQYIHPYIHPHTHTHPHSLSSPPREHQTPAPAPPRPCNSRLASPTSPIQPVQSTSLHQIVSSAATPPVLSLGQSPLILNPLNPRTPHRSASPIPAESALPSLPPAVSYYH